MNNKHDFLDGNGPVAARQHRNGGGWVAETATVAETAFVGPLALVYGNARIYDRVLVLGEAEVYGNARVYDRVLVGGNARVFGNAEVFGEAWVGGNAEVYGRAWVGGNAEVYGRARVSEGELTEPSPTPTAPTYTPERPQIVGGESMATEMSANQASKRDDGKPHPSYLPWAALKDVMAVTDFGAKKYSPHGWSGVEAQLYVESLLRHSIEFAERYRFDGVRCLDAESGLPVLAHLVSNALILLAHPSNNPSHIEGEPECCADCQ